MRVINTKEMKEIGEYKDPRKMYVAVAKRMGYKPPYQLEGPAQKYFEKNGRYVGGEKPYMIELPKVEKPN